MNLNLLKSCIYCQRLRGEFICSRCWGLFFEKIDELEKLQVLDKSIEVDTGFVYNKATSHFWQMAKHKGFFRIIGSLVGYWEINLNLQTYIDKYDVIYIVPVPIHKNKLRKRGFNQVLVLAKYIERKFIENFPGKKIEVQDILIRNINSKTQIGQNNISREDNLEAIFGLENDLHLNFNGSYQEALFILIDDVYTTGTTLKLCAMQLLKITDKIAAITFTRR